VLCLVDSKWVTSKTDHVLVLSGGQLLFVDTDMKECKRPLKDVLNCKDFAPFETLGEQLHLALLCTKAVLIVHVQPDETFARKQILSLDEDPLSFAVSGSSILLQYAKELERILLVTGKTQEQPRLDRIRTCSNSNLSYIEELQVFVFMLDHVSYFVPEKGPCDINTYKVKWKTSPKQLFVVDPYLIGLSDKGIEIHNYYMPNTVVQYEENMSAQVLACGTSDYVGLLHEITESLPWFFVVAQRVNKVSVCIMEQKPLDELCKTFVEANEYKLALSVCDVFIRRNYKRTVTTDEYITIQRERGYHLFLVEKNYKKAKRLFEKYDAPPQEVLLLFAELLHRQSIETLINLFKIDSNCTPCYWSLYMASAEETAISQPRMRELVKQLKVFMLFFLKTRQRLIDSIQACKQNLVVENPKPDDVLLDKTTETRLEHLTFLKMLYEIVFFHGCLILLMCKDQDAQLVLKEFHGMVAEENSLPASICEDLLNKYELYSILFQFLAAKKMYGKLLLCVKELYTSGRKPADTFSGDVKQHWVNETVRIAQDINSKT
jgi:hypothetical protein